MLNLASKNSTVYSRHEEQSGTYGGCDKPRKLLICLKKNDERDKKVLPMEDKVDFYYPCSKVSGLFL